jgi:hypothetical protein
LHSKNLYFLTKSIEDELESGVLQGLVFYGNWEWDGAWEWGWGGSMGLG